MATPFLSADIADLIVTHTPPGRDTRVLTALTRAGVGAGFLSVDGLRLLAGSGYVIKSIVNLHAKVVLVDDSYGLVGSGNLTAAGLNGGNVELGVQLTPAQIASAVRLFDEWWEEATEVADRALNAADKWPRRATTTRGGRANGIGARIPVAPGQAFAKHRALRGDLNGLGLWIKPMHFTSERTRAKHWTTVDRLTDPHEMRGDRMVQRPGYRPGDLILIYLGGTRRCPAILEVMHEPYPDAEEARAAGGDDAGRGWFTPVAVRGAVDLEDAPRLETLGIPSYLVQRRPRARLTRARFDRARRAIAKAERPRPRKRRRSARS